MRVKQHLHLQSINKPIHQLIVLLIIVMLVPAL
jgi:hypothetical protein